MKKMLGEELVALGAINEVQLGKGLKAQLVHGGHLGTCLIELGYINEQRLGEALASILGVEHAGSDVFLNIPDVVIKSVTRDLAERHRVIPLRLEDRTLHLAMVAPKDLAAIDELQFSTGRAIQAWVAPEIRIVHALDNYYGVPRSRRFLLLSPDPSEIARSAIPETPPALRTTAPPVWADMSSDECYTAEPLRQLSDAIDEVGDAMCAALDTGQLGAAVLDCVSVGVERTILFRVHKQVARIWDSRGFETLHEVQDECAFSVVEEPVFELLAGDAGYLGPLDARRADRGFFHDFGIDRPAAVLLLPVYLDDHLVAMLYADGGTDGDIEGSLAEYQRVAQKIGPALEMQALARRVRRL